MKKHKEKPARRRRKTLVQCVNDLSYEASVLLFSGLPICLIASLSFLSSVLRAMKTDPELVRLIYPPLLEYIFMGLTVTVIGAIVLDVSDKS